MMKTYVFPGQGAQYKGMGEQLFKEFPELIEKANMILGYSIQSLCLDNPDEKLNLTQYTQPALFIVNALTYYKKLQETNTQPDFLAGHSLGEYNAILAAGGFDFETGLKLVKKRGELMSRASGGAMAAVIGLPEKKITEILKGNPLMTKIDVANLNAPTQIVISGNKDDIAYAKPFFEREGAAYVELNVSAAFHSRYMQEAREEFAAYLKGFTFSPLTIPVISNVTAAPYSPDDFISNLADQLRSSVKWTDSIGYLLRQGEMEFEELGPGQVLTRLIAKIVAEAPAVRHEDIDLKAGDKEGRTEYKRIIEATYQKIEAWNKRYPVGTKVTCSGYDHLKTRTEAMVLFGHRAAIYIEGYNGYFALDEVTPV